MKAARRAARKRPSIGQSLGHRDAPSARTQSDSGAASPLEARLCELELRLTQFELENRRLREAYRQIEATSASQSKLQDLAPVGTVTLDVRGTILDINHTGATMTGRD